jgi:hypothetical protein
MGTPLQKRSQVAAGAGGWGGANNITKSTWFDGSADRLALNFGTTGDTRNWTYSGWWRHNNEDNNVHLLTSYFNGSNYETIYVYSSSTTQMNYLWYSIIGGVDYSRYWTTKQRDGEWSHFCCVADTAQAAAADRMKMYHNGVEITAYTEPAGTLPQNYDTYINRISSITHNIGYYPANGLYSEGQKAQLAFVDGTSHAVTDFGEFVTVGTNGQIWAPLSDADVKVHVDAGGSNSFLLSSAMGDGTDDSTKGNDWTPTSMSDAANGLTEDTPSNPAPIFHKAYKVGPTSFNVYSAEGGQRLYGNNAGQYHEGIMSLGIPDTGKWYFEVELQVGEDTSTAGISDLGTRTWTHSPGQSTNDSCILNNGSAARVTRIGNVDSNTRTADSASDIWQIAFDADTGEVWYGRNDTWYGTGSPEPDTGTDPTYTHTIHPESNFAFTMSSDTGGNCKLMREGEWTYTVPTDYKELRWSNLPEPPTTQGADLFNPVLYQGTGVALSVTGTGFAPDIVWIKARTSSLNHALFDTSRGVFNRLLPSAGSPTGGGADTLTSFDTDGFTLSTSLTENTGGVDYVAWQWLAAGGTTASNTDGDITSTVQVAPEGHLSIIQYVGNGTSGQTVGHGLPSAPDMIIHKNRDTADSWRVWANGMAASEALFLDLSNAKSTDNSYTAEPTDTLLTLGSIRPINGNTHDLVAYAFRNVPGLLRVGLYKGNGNALGPYVPVGFKPRFILLKGAIANTEWHMFDTARGVYNENSKYLEADTTASEGSTKGMDMLANGFKLRTVSSDNNSSGTTYFYLAIADVATGSGLPPIPGR